MSYTNIQKLRKLIGDPFSYAEDTQNGDGGSTQFELSHKNVKDDSYEVLVAGTPVVETTDYTIDQEAGIITFEEAPANEAEVKVTYQFSAFSEDELNNYLEDEGGVDEAAIRLVDILLFDSAKRFDYSTGKTDLQPSQVFANLKELRKVLTERINSKGKDVIIADRSSQYYEGTSRTSVDLSRDDLGEENLPWSNNA